MYDVPEHVQPISEAISIGNSEKLLGKVDVARLTSSRV